MKPTIVHVLFLVGVAVLVGVAAYAGVLAERRMVRLETGRNGHPAELHAAPPVFPTPEGSAVYFRLVAPADPDPRPVCRNYGHTVAVLTATVDYCRECGQRFPASERPAPVVVELATLAAALRRMPRLSPDMVAEVLTAAGDAAVLLPADTLTPARV
jgi:hypothetical protein